MSERKAVEDAISGIKDLIEVVFDDEYWTETDTQKLRAVVRLANIGAAVEAKRRGKK